MWREKDFHSPPPLCHNVRNHSCDIILCTHIYAHTHTPSVASNNVSRKQIRRFTWVPSCVEQMHEAVVGATPHRTCANPTQEGILINPGFLPRTEELYRHTCKKLLVWMLNAMPAVRLWDREGKHVVDATALHRNSIFSDSTMVCIMHTSTLYIPANCAWYSLILHIIWVALASLPHASKLMFFMDFAYIAGSRQTTSLTLYSIIHYFMKFHSIISFHFYETKWKPKAKASLMCVCVCCFFSGFCFSFLKGLGPFFFLFYSRNILAPSLWQLQLF